MAEWPITERVPESPSVNIAPADVPIVTERFDQPDASIESDGAAIEKTADGGSALRFKGGRSGARLTLPVSQPVSDIDVALRFEVISRSTGQSPCSLSRTPDERRLQSRHVSEGNSRAHCWRSNGHLSDAGCDRRLA